MTNSINLKLNENFIVVETEQNNAKQTKNIDYRGLENLFQQTSSTFTTPLLPGEYGMKKMAMKGNQTLIAYTEAPRVVDIKYEFGRRPIFREHYFTAEEWGTEQGEDETREDYIHRLRVLFREKIEETRNKRDDYYIHRFKFMSPRLLFLMTLIQRPDQTYRTRAHQFFAMKNAVLSGQEPLFGAPFSNVYGHNEICWGNNDVKLPSLMAVQGLSSMFFNAPFNSDLDASRFSSFEATYDDERDQTIRTFVQLAHLVSLKIESGEDPNDVLDFVNSKLLRVRSSFDDVFSRYQSDL